MKMLNFGTRLSVHLIGNPLNRGFTVNAFPLFIRGYLLYMGHGGVFH